MPNKNGYFDTDNRQLTDVFRELQQTRLQYENQNAKKASKITSSNSNTYNKKNVKKASNSNSPHSKTLRITLIFILLLIAVVMALLGSNSISAKDPSIELYSPLSEIGKSSVSIEINRHRLNAHNIITSNAALETVKQQVVEEKDIPFETLYTERNLLPKGEEVVLQTGTNGKKNVTYVRSYDNGELTEETILQEEKTQDFIPQIVDVGTSEFLAKIKAHLKDTLYLTKDSILREETSDTSKELAEIKTYYDVTLLDLPSEDWCKVSYDGIEGYLSTKNLTSAAATPSMPEKNRITKIIVKLDKDMPLNQSSGLTLADYKKIFTGLPNDKNKIFENNSKYFYYIEKEYNINGMFVAAIGIHESAWGTSKIAKNKKNLFGYGAYDSNPYNGAYEFTKYSESIDLISRVLVKYYLNPKGTSIYGGEQAVGTYYSEPTLAGVNKKYASDKNWANAVYKHIKYLYGKL